MIIKLGNVPSCPIFATKQSCSGTTEMIPPFYSCRRRTGSAVFCVVNNFLDRIDPLCDRGDNQRDHDRDAERNVQ